MEIERIEVTIGDVVNGYLNKDEEGVVGYGGKAVYVRIVVKRKSP